MKSSSVAFLLFCLLAAVPMRGDTGAMLVDPRVIQATIEERRAWIIEQATGPGSLWFEEEFGPIFEEKDIGATEARLYAHLFLYSTGTKGGYFDTAVREGDLWKLSFRLEFGLAEGFPVFVDSTSGLAWQEGQSVKVDLRALTRLFLEKRKERQPNQALQTTSVTRSGFGRVSVSDRQRRGV